MDLDGMKGFISRYLGDVFAVRSSLLHATYKTLRLLGLVWSVLRNQPSVCLGLP